MKPQPLNNDLRLTTSFPEIQSISFRQDDPVTRNSQPTSKKSFLVFKHNKYIIVPTESIALFYIKYESSIIVCFDRQEYFLDYSLDHIHGLLGNGQFFRLNRQHLINFQAIKDVEHYFARKLLVNPTIPVTDKLLVPKERTSSFLSWLEER